MPVPPFAIKKLIPPGPNDPRIKPRVVILHVAVSEQPSLYAYFNGPSGGVESHFYIRRDGTTECYRDTNWQADANTDANGFAISIETQGMEKGEWTGQQLDAIKALILWCHTTHDIPLQRCPSWDGSGIGYHTLFPGRWDKRGASCPGPDRKLQFNQIITPWLTAPAPVEDDMPLNDADKAWITNKLDANQRWLSARIDQTVNRSLAKLLARDPNGVSAEDIAAAIPADIAQQVADNLIKRLES